MTLQQLEYILALNRLGNFAKAADYCDVTQPTLSSMIQKLENELGIKIFDRRRQPIITTKAGQAVIRQAKEVLYQSRRLREIVEEEKDTYLGTFTIGVLPTIAPYLIPHFFPQLMREHPEMDLRIVELKTKDMKQALLNGDIDAGILAKIEGLEMFNSTHLYTEKYFAYISESDPLFAKERIKTTDLNGEFLWLLDEGHCFRDQLVKFCHLKAVFRMYGMDYPDYPFYCTLIASRRVWPGGHHNLDIIAARCGYDLKNHHHALADAEACAAIALEIL